MRGIWSAAAIVVAGAGVTLPAHAGSNIDGAEKVRRLDIMLMVTGLRCRIGRDDFSSEYGKFTRRHMATLNAANAELRARYVNRRGQTGGQRALDKASTSMANRYGQGHPWLDCRELRKVTRNLAKMRDRGDLEAAADALLARNRSKRFAYLGR